MLKCKMTGGNDPEPQRLHLTQNNAANSVAGISLFVLPYLYVYESIYIK